MENYTSFVSLDLETTGLDPSEDEVLEIGAVRIENGNPAAEFSQLVRPESPIPFQISQLTGITEDDLQDQPPIEEILPHLSPFIGSSPIVCHNAAFDLSFLKQFRLENPVWDTLELARIVLPWAKNHRLEYLLTIFGIESGRRHRSLDDARGVARLFLRLMQFLEETDPHPLQLIGHLAEPVEWGLSDLFRDALKKSLKRGLRTGKPPQIGPLPPRNVIGKAGGETVDAGEVQSYFDPSGRLSSILEGYEYREEQLEMAEEVVKSLEEDALLACEAGTGIGKSLAYLIPSFLWSAENRERVVISTNTKNLQDQLFYKDIPLLLECFDFGFKAVLLKGRANYLCLRKWHQVTAGPDLHLSPDERIAALPLVLWVERTESGDISENRGFYLRENSSLWNKLRCDAKGCPGSECHHHSRCFVTRARREAQDANLVVVNHSLLLSDLTAENKVLGPYQRLVVDEAHNLEKVATEHLGLKVGPWTINILLDLLYTDHPAPKGLIPSLKARIERSRVEHANLEMLFAELDRVTHLVEGARERMREFFEKLVALASSPYGKLRYWKHHTILNKLAQETEAMLTLLSEICQALSRADASLSELGPSRLEGYREAKADLEGRLGELREVFDALRILTSGEKENLCYWVRVFDNHAAELHGVPIEVAPLLAASLYPALRSGLFTSATLTVGDSFDYFLQRTGLDLAARGRVRERMLGSPFDFPKQVLTILPKYLPSPQQNEFPRAVAELLSGVVLETKRGSLVLLTSYRLLNRLYEELREEFDRRKTSLLAQGVGGSRTKLIEQFREERGSVLLGTDSFWEGVDVPGEALEILVISKLPFPVPSEPIVEARSEVIQARGGDAFRELMLPETIIRFRQGFGRLIRNKRDRGVVMILDNRTLERDYGRLFLSSLPVETEICHSQEEVEARVRGWWDGNH